MKISVSEHAVERYRERVRPELTIAEARTELIERCRSGDLLTEAPWPSLRSDEVIGWIVVAFGAAVAIVRGHRGGRVAVSCLVNPAFHVKRA